MSMDPMASVSLKWRGDGIGSIMRGFYAMIDRVQRQVSNQSYYVN